MLDTWVAVWLYGWIMAVWLDGYFVGWWSSLYLTLTTHKHCTQQ